MVIYGNQKIKSNLEKYFPNIYTSLKDLASYIKSQTKETIMEEKFIIYEPALLADSSLNIDKTKFLSILNKNSQVYLVLDKLDYNKIDNYYKEDIIKIFIKNEFNIDHSYILYMLKLKFNSELQEILKLDNINLKDSLKTFVEKLNETSFEPNQLKYILEMKSNLLSYIITYMNSTAVFNETINELNEKIQQLETRANEIETYKQKLSEKDDTISSLYLQINEKDTKIDKYEGLIKIYSDKLESKINEFFIPIKLFLEKKDYKKILYFKEYDYVNYSYTFLRLLQTYFKLKKQSCRFIIYDNLSNQLRGVYYKDFYKFQPIQLQHAEELMKKFDKFYVNEPREEITKKMIFENPADYTIIWDRTYNFMHLLEDSPNLLKFHMTNSPYIIEQCKLDKNMVISSSLTDVNLCIPYIDKFEMMKYEDIELQAYKEFINKFIQYSENLFVTI